MAQPSRTILFVGGAFLPPYEIITFKINEQRVTEETAKIFFDAELDQRNKEGFHPIGMALLRDESAVGVFQHQSSGKLNFLLLSVVSTDFEINVGKLAGDSIPDETGMSEFINREMIAQDVHVWTTGQVFELMEIEIPITIALVQSRL